MSVTKPFIEEAMIAGYPTIRLTGCPVVLPNRARPAFAVRMLPSISVVPSSQGEAELTASLCRRLPVRSSDGETLFIKAGHPEHELLRRIDFTRR